MDYPEYWIVTNPAAMGENLGGLRNPNVVTALVIDGFSTDDGQVFDKPPFASGTSDGIFMVLEGEVGHKVYDRMAGYINGRPSRKENVENDNEVVVGKWELSGDRVALFVADSGGTDAAQSAFETCLGLEGILLQRSSKAIMGSRFNAQEILDENKEVFSEEARLALAELVAAVPAPRARAARPR